jgi:hypothetical protein
MTDTPKTPLQQLWQEQPVEGTRMPIDEIRRRAVKFERRIFWMNAREYISSAIGIALTLFFLIRTHDTLSRVAFGLIIAGVTYAMVHLYVKGRPGTASEQAGTQCVPYFLDELERTRKLVGNLWWYLGPLVPGLLLLAVASARLHPQPAALVALVVSNLVIAAAFAFVIRLNARAARCLQKQIDEIRSAQALEG